MQEQTPSSKWWKWMAPLTMFALPTIFQMNSGSVAIFTNPKIFSYLKRNTRSCVDELKCNRQFLAMVMQMKYLFFFFHIIQNKFCTRHIPRHPAWAMSISTVLHEFQSSGGGLDPLLQRYAPHYSLQSRCEHFFAPFSFLWCSTVSQRYMLPTAAKMFDGNT